MRAVIEPVLDVEYFANLTDDPTYSFNIFGGCLTASLPCVLTDRQRASLDLAKVSLYGSEGLVWSGFVWEKPKPGEPLVALGPNCGIAMGPVVSFTSNTKASAAISTLFAASASVPTWLLPAGAAYRAFINDSGYTITAPNIIEANPIDAVKSLLDYQDFDFGWYPEWIAGVRVCVPHFIARSTTPDYVLALRDATQMLDGGSMEPLASSVRVVFNGGSSYVDVHDTNTAHTLVRLGRVKWSTIEVSTTDSGAATTAGTAHLTRAGRDQIKASIKSAKKPTKKQRAAFKSSLKQARAAGGYGFGAAAGGGVIPAGLVRSVNGGSVPYSAIRPGQMLRMFTRDGVKDATIREVTLVGERAATITVDNSPNRLDVYLARVASKKK